MGVRYSPGWGISLLESMSVDEILSTSFDLDRFPSDRNIIGTSKLIVDEFQHVASKMFLTNEINVFGDYVISNVTSAINLPSDA